MSPGPAVVTASRSEQFDGKHCPSLVSASFVTRSVSGVRVTLILKQIRALSPSVPVTHVSTPDVPVASPPVADATPVNVAAVLGSGLTPSHRSRALVSTGGRLNDNVWHPLTPTGAGGHTPGSMSTRSEGNGSLESHNSIRIGIMPPLSAVDIDAVCDQPTVDGVLLSATTGP